MGDLSATELFLAGIVATMIGFWVKARVEDFTRRDERLADADEKQGATVADLRTQVAALQATVAHIAQDQEAHRRHGEQIAALSTAFNAYQGESIKAFERIERQNDRIEKQNLAIWKRLGGEVRRSNGAAAH